MEKKDSMDDEVGNKKLAYFAQKMLEGVGAEYES